MSNDLDEIRHQLIKLARRKKTRVTEWSKNMPCDWRPTQVVDPESGECFTEAGAWEFIADHLERGEPLEEIRLRKPPGKLAYVMIVPGGTDKPKIYIKLQLGSGRIIARSFHYDERYQEEPPE